MVVSMILLKSYIYDLLRATSYACFMPCLIQLFFEKCLFGLETA